MIARSSLSRSVLRRQCCCQPSTTARRGLAAAASGTFSYETGEADGVKFASRNLAGPTTTLAVVARAGTRFQPAPGLTEGLNSFAFKVREAIMDQQEERFQSDWAEPAELFCQTPTGRIYVCSSQQLTGNL